ncbi:MAG: Npt1/Npt2 family nucleotide transporter [Candidatus Babeliales bacterium]
MIEKIAAALWGHFESKEELKKFSLLALIFGLIICTYWTMRPLKDSIFNAMVGGQYLWLAKIISVFVIAPLVIFYSKLVDMFPRHKVFYLLNFLYIVTALCFLVVFLQPTVGLANTVSSPTRYLGWAWYAFVESYGSLLVALFWAFATDITLPDAAKRGFPLIALFGQLGNIIGPFFLNTRSLGFQTSAPIVGIAVVIMGISCLVMWFFRYTTPKQLLVGYHAEDIKKVKQGSVFLEGLRLLFTHTYLLGIFFIITIYEVIVTIIDYHFMQTAFATFISEADVSTFLAQYGYKVGIVSSLCVLFGINNIQRHLGMKISLMLLPILILVAVITIQFNPSSLTVVLWIMVFSKAVNYALNQPTIKQLYIPTSHDSKYKAQAWIDMFGSRGSKAGIQFFNAFRSRLGVDLFLTITLFLTIGCVAGWLFIAVFVANTYDKAIKENQIVC